VVDSLLSVHRVPDGPHNTGELRVRGSGGVPSIGLRPDGTSALAGARLEPGAVTRYLSETHIRIRA